MLSLLPARERRPTPWKNGQGRTTEIAIRPPGAGLDRFDWRASIAEVAVSGPFSSFPGLDRWLAVLDGAMTLAIDGAAPLALDAGAVPVRFPGDVPVWAEVRSGPVRDLNIMTARGRVTADIRRLQLEPGVPLRLAAADEMLLVCLSGEVQVGLDDGASAVLGELDAALITAAAGFVEAGASARLVAASFTRAAG